MNHSNCESAIHSFLELNHNYIINLREYEEKERERKEEYIMYASTAALLVRCYSCNRELHTYIHITTYSKRSYVYVFINSSFF